MSQSTPTTSSSEVQQKPQETPITPTNNNNIIDNNNKPAEQELVFILENGTEPTPVRAIKRPEPQLRAPVHVPFPPAINAADLIRTNKSGALLARCTNKFLIYRNEFAKEVRTQGYNLSMSEVSCLAAQAWKQEPNYVIRKYADIAHEVKWLHKQLARSNSRARRRISSDPSPNPIPSEVNEQTIYTTQNKRANLLTRQFPPEMFRFNNNLHYQQQKNDISPLISSPLTPITPITPITPLTPTMFSPTLLYHPKMSDVVTSNITVPLNTTVNPMMFSPPIREERYLNHAASSAAVNLEMIPSYEIPVSYCGESEPFSMGIW